MPLLREVRPRWIGNAYSIGLSDTSNDCPRGIKGFFSKASARQWWRLASKLKACRKTGLSYALFTFKTLFRLIPINLAKKNISYILNELPGCHIGDN